VAEVSREADLHRAKIWSCDAGYYRVWHGYVPDTINPNQPCLCHTWDWTFPTWEAALNYVDFMIRLVYS
jgi:hypothetical protein